MTDFFFESVHSKNARVIKQGLRSSEGDIYCTHEQTFSIPPSTNGHWLSATLPRKTNGLIKSWRSICSVANICAVGILKEKLVHHCKFSSFVCLYQLVLRKSVWSSVHHSGFVLPISSLSYRPSSLNFSVSFLPPSGGDLRSFLYFCFPLY